MEAQKSSFATLQNVYRLPSPAGSAWAWPDQDPVATYRHDVETEEITLARPEPDNCLEEVLPSERGDVVDDEDNDAHSASDSSEDDMHLLVTLPPSRPTLDAKHVVDDEDNDAHSASDSSEDDMHLLVTLPPSRPTLDAKHVFAGIKDELTITALHEFVQAVFPPSLPPRKRPNTPLSGPPSKRQRLSSASAAAVELAQEADAHDADLVHVLKRDLTLGPTAFACPFYVQEPARHRTCLTRAHLPELGAVKQHLWAVHRRPAFCPVCREVFDTWGAFESHVRARTCEAREREHVEGITEEQVVLLARRADPSMGPEDQWLALWDVVFPDSRRRPADVWLTGETERTVSMLREWWALKGQDVAAEFLKGKGLVGYEVQDEETGLEALYEDVLDQMVDMIVDRFHSQGDAYFADTQHVKGVGGEGGRSYLRKLFSLLRLA